MIWKKKNYRIATKDGAEIRYDGYSNGTFAHNALYTLTHLQSGLKIADFTSRADARRVGDYLKEVYAAEFERFDEAVKPTIVPEEISSLPERADLEQLLKADGHLTDLLKRLAVRETSENAG